MGFNTALMFFILQDFSATAVTADTVLEVDWDGDGDFGDPGEMISGDVMAISCYRGRDYASQLQGRAVAGSLQATLRNDDGKFSSFNTASPLYGNLLPGRKVRLRVTSPVSAVLWTGYLSRIEPHTTPGPYATATLYAAGPFVRLGGPNAKVSPAAQENVPTGDLVDAVLDAIDWDAAARSIQPGNVEIARWFAEDVEALAALQEIEDTEQGFLYEGLAWDVIFEQRYHRDVNELTSQATYSDHAAASYGYMAIDQADPLQEIFNEFEATVQPYNEEVSASVLWTLSGETPSLAAGQSRTYIAKATSLNGEQIAYVSAWTTPVAGTDIVQTGVSNGDIGISAAKKALSMEVTITNNHGSAAATLTLVQARGIAVTSLNPFKITASDTPSQVKYGKRRYPLSSPWYFNSAYAEGTASYLLDRQAEPRPILTLTFASKKSAALQTEMVQRALSDRVTVQADQNAKLGISGDFHVEGIAHEFSQGSTWHQTTLLLSPAVADPGWWVLEVADDLGTDTVLAY